MHILTNIATGLPADPRNMRDFGAQTPPDVSHKGWRWDLYVEPPPPPETDEQRRARLRWDRVLAVQAIKVTTAAGNTFDGDEISQGRMARAIIALNATGTPSVTWVLANNSTIQATAAELTEALSLAGAAQAAIWVIE